MTKRKNRVQFTFKEPSLTKQSFADETDINRIMSRYETTGQLPQPNNQSPQYGDFSQVSSYQEALAQITTANAAFANMPSNLRAQFNNDPELFVEFASDPNNLDKLREMGLAPPEPTKPIPTPTPEEKSLKTQPNPSQKEVETKK